MIRRVVNNSNTKSGQIGKFYQPPQELGTASAAFRSVIYINDKLFHITKILLSLFPPEKKAVDNGKQLAALWIDVQLLSQQGKKPLRAMPGADSQLAAAIGDFIGFYRLRHTFPEQWRSRCGRHNSALPFVERPSVQHRGVFWD